MAKQPSISGLAAIAACDSIVDLVDGGAAAGKLRIYDGTKPANTDTAITTQNILSEHTMNDPAFGAAADQAPNAQATANAIADDTSANNTGTATWFRVFDSNDVAVFDGTVATSNADLVMDSTSITAGQTVKVNSLTFTVREV